jgi:hypothetical protein
MPKRPQTSGHCTYRTVTGGNPCPQLAVVHLLLARPADPASPQSPGPVNIAACRRHAPIARTLGPIRAEHPYTVDCADPDTTWRLAKPDNGDPSCIINQCGPADPPAANPRRTRATSGAKRT